MRRQGFLMLACAALIAPATAGCDTGSLLGPQAPQGIEGIVLLGPQCPVQTLGNPCPDIPYEAWIRVGTRDGVSVTRVRSGVDGRFRVGLRPGLYTLHPESGDPFPIAADQDVEVREGVYTEIAVSFDTGIR